MIDTKIYGQNTKPNIIKHLMMEFRNITVWSCYSISFDMKSDDVTQNIRISHHQTIYWKKKELKFTNQFPRKLKKIFTKFFPPSISPMGVPDLSRGSSLNWLRNPALETPTTVLQIAGHVWWFVSWKTFRELWSDRKKNLVTHVFGDWTNGFCIKNQMFLKYKRLVFWG